MLGALSKRDIFNYLFFKNVSSHLISKSSIINFDATWSSRRQNFRLWNSVTSLTTWHDSTSYVPYTRPPPVFENTLLYLLTSLSQRTVFLQSNVVHIFWTCSIALYYTIEDLQVHVVVAVKVKIKYCGNWFHGCFFYFQYNNYWLFWKFWDQN